MHDRFFVLEETIKRVCGSGPVYYLANRGNLGDALIRYGTLKFFHDIQLDYRELSENRWQWVRPVLQGGTVIYGGGGGWSQLWRHSQACVARLKRRFEVIVLPSTFGQHYPLQDLTVFCRDKQESQDNMPFATFCHDMAFYIGREFYKPVRSGRVGYFFRTDQERHADSRLPKGNRDISLEGHERSEVEGFFEAVNAVSVVHTDRLHVAIAGCLLEKEVHLYPGNYFKNRAVYESSLRARFENVFFHEHDYREELPAAMAGLR